jgi:hypothetical protein
MNRKLGNAGVMRWAKQKEVFGLIQQLGLLEGQCNK